MEKLLTRLELAKVLGVSNTTLDKLRNQGGFVKPVKLGPLLRWREEDVKAWLDQQITDGDAA